jgi:hypothetical protein
MPLTLLVVWSQALFFVSASIKSGRAVPLNSVIVGLLHPIFSLQVRVQPLFPDFATQKTHMLISVLHHSKRVFFSR